MAIFHALRWVGSRRLFFWHEITRRFFFFFSFSNHFFSFCPCVASFAVKEDASSLAWSGYLPPCSQALLYITGFLYMIWRSKRLIVFSCVSCFLTFVFQTGRTKAEVTKLLPEHFCLSYLLFLQFLDINRVSCVLYFLTFMSQKGQITARRIKLLLEHFSYSCQLFLKG